MIQFPEAARVEWQTVADSIDAGVRLRKSIQRATEVEHALERLRIRHEANILHQQEIDAENTPELELMTLTDYKNDTSMAPRDLIHGVMKADGLCLVLGPSKSGKSTLALTMLHSLMTGDDWLGQPVDKIDGGVGIVSYDMDASMMLDWMSGFPGVDPSKVGMVNAHRRGNPLGVAAHRATIAKAWEAMGVDVVLVDSFSASFFGHDQNDAAATMGHYRDLQEFTRECGASALIVIVHSTDNNPMKPRGSSVHIDTADTIVTVSGTDIDPRTVTVGKYRAAHGQKQMGVVMITPPDDVTHLVSLDTAAMGLAGLTLPASVSAMFPTLDQAIEAPDVSEAFDDYDGEDGL